MMMMIDDVEVALLFLVGVVDLVLFFGSCCCWILNLPVFVYGFQLFSLRVKIDCWCACWSSRAAEEEMLLVCLCCCASVLG